MNFRFALFAALFVFTACGGEGVDLEDDTTSREEGQCTIDPAELKDGGVARDQIPSLQNPTFVGPEDPEASYLRPYDRVIGLTIGDRTLAVPHNILWWHEVLNVDLPEGKFAITYCPLTGTALAFDREGIGGAELGVSGLLFRNNLVMFDRADGLETLFPQIMGEGVCGLRKRFELKRIAIAEMRWDAWLDRHPETEVVSGETGFSRDYQVYPYGNYEDLEEPPFQPTSFDQSRLPKERLMGVEGPNGGIIAFPFLELEKLGELAVLNVTLDGEPLAVVWDADAETALVFSRRPRSAVGGERPPLTFLIEDGRLTDAETGTEWSLTGRGVSGELTTFELKRHPRAMVAFWFAWTTFHPDTQVWIAPEDGG